MTYTGTYDPEDNKLRLYASERLDPETYARMKAAGYIWAPKQGFFVAPMWTPAREDLLLELCGEIGDEDTSLVERAEERAERFETYSENRAEDYERAKNGVAAIADNIPLGQPILVGHHSEKHARKDAARIENGMRKAVAMWEQSKYWEDRAKGAIRHAKYKERPDVRARRIKGLEADKRRLIADYTPDPRQPAIMQPDWHDRSENAEKIPHVWCGLSRGGHWVAVKNLEAIKARNARIITHIDHRLLYEKTMLAEAGGLADEKFNLEVGGKVLVRGEWVVILKINKSGGKISSLSTNRHYVPQVGIEEVKDYRAPEEGQTEKIKKALALPPMCNYPGEGFCKMTKANYASIYTDSKGGRIIKATDTAGTHRVRSVMAHIARRVDPECTAAKGQGWGPVNVFITDEKRKDPPAPDLIKTEPVKIDPPEPVYSSRPVYVAPDRSEIDALKDAIKEGVRVVVAPQLFPTPPEIAEKMVEYAEIEPGNRVLEPSAGTGNILSAIWETGIKPVEITAVEINYEMAKRLRVNCAGLRPKEKIIRADFLEQNGNLGKFDRVIMNPPFENGSDIKHINHALAFLNPGGRLVALCANGPRQRAAFQDMADYWEDLPAGSFKDQGTGVNVALMVINKAPEVKQFTDGLF